MLDAIDDMKFISYYYTGLYKKKFSPDMIHTDIDAHQVKPG